MLVDVPADSVARAVEEGGAVPGIDDDLAGGGVDLACRNAGLDDVESGLVSAVDDVVDLEGAVAGGAEGANAGDVALVALDFATEVEQEDFAVFDGGVVGEVVGLGRVRAGGDDGEGGGSPLLGHEVSEHLGDLEFGLADSEQRLDGGKGVVRNLPGALHQLDLIGLLDQHERADQALAVSEEGGGEDVLHLEEQAGGQGGVDADDGGAESPVFGELLEVDLGVLAVLPDADVLDAGSPCLGLG